MNLNLNLYEASWHIASLFFSFAVSIPLSNKIDEMSHTCLIPIQCNICSQHDNPKGFPLFIFQLYQPYHEAITTTSRSETLVKK